MDKIQRIHKLVEQLNTYRDEYYNLNKPTVPDATYDKLFDELSTLEKQTGLVLSNSPTQTVGYEVISKLQKVEHPIPLKSLDKTKSIDEINQWRNNQDILAMLKGDGLTNEIVYDNGFLLQGSTRGNSIIGELITHNCKTYKNLPKTISFKGFLRLAGESVIHKNDFDKINEGLLDEDKYATPRNLVSGSCRQLNSEICSQREVYFYAFGILECSENLSDSKYEQFKWLNELGFTTIYNVQLNKNDVITDNLVNQMYQVAEENSIPIDGLVFSFDSVKYSESLGEVSHHPKHSIALKAIDEMEETILRSVEWNTTRSGQINPTAIFDTVILDNTEVSRASLFNLTFIKDMQLNLLNTIKVSKRNMIIPYIEENLDKQEGNYIPIPIECPSCRAKTEIRNTGTADFLYCTNDDCPAKLLDKFVHFCSRNAMNIDGFSNASLEKFIDCGFLSDFSDLYNLEQYKSKIVSLDGWGTKSYNKLIQAIEKSKEVKLENFLYALGIGQLGQGGSKRLAKHFGYDINAFMRATSNPLNFTSIEDFGDVTANSICNYFKKTDNLRLVLDLLQYVTIKKPEEKEISNTGNPFAGKKIYATGTFASYKKDELKAIVESLGAEFTSGYAKSLDYLVEGSLKSSSKVDKALKDGVKILSEDEFLKMIGNIN